MAKFEDMLKIIRDGGSVRKLSWANNRYFIKQKEGTNVLVDSNDDAYNMEGKDILADDWVVKDYVPPITKKSVEEENCLFGCSLCDYDEPKKIERLAVSKPERHSEIDHRYKINEIIDWINKQEKSDGKGSGQR